MDPLSFAASIITVAALVATSSEKICDLRERLKNAPRDVETLLEQLRTFESLLKELETQLQDHRNSAPPQETLQHVWGSSVAQMQRDVQSLQTVLSKVEPLLKKKSRTSRVLLLARQKLSEKDVEQYQRKIDTHCGTLTSIQAMVCGRKLDKLSQKIIQLSDEDKTSFGTVASQLSQSTSQLSTEVKAGLSTVSSQLTSTESVNGARHQALLAHLDDHTKSDNLNVEKMDDIFQGQMRSIDISEAGFQAIQSSLITTSSSSSSEQKKTHAMLNQLRGQIQQILRNHITFGPVEHSVHSPSVRPRALEPTTTETTVFWKHYSHRLPIGTLHVRLNQTRQTRNSRHSTPQICTESKIAVEFVPPPWLSNVVIKYCMKLSWDLIDSQWRWGATLKPLTVNHDPFFINAIMRLDVEGVRKSFAMGLAKPTDHVITEYGKLVPWYKKWWSDGKYIAEYANWVPRMSLMVNYMVRSGLPGRHIVISLFLGLLGNKDQDLQQKHLQQYVKHGGTLFGKQSSIIFGKQSSMFEVVVSRFRAYRVDWIPDILSKSSEPWLVDDLSSLEICFVGACAHVDAVFRERLKKTLASYRLSAFSNREPYIDHVFETTFGRDSIEGHFSAMTHYKKYDFLSQLCRTSSVSMIKLFIDMGIDVNGGDWTYNLLGQAAAGGNIDVVCMLLKAGAHSSSALEYFLYGSGHLSDAVFKRLLEMLVEHARPASFAEIQDPLLAVFQSSRALHLHPKAPEILLKRQVFTDESFGKGADRVSNMYSYMYQAIFARAAVLVDLLLQNGAQFHAQTSDLYTHSGARLGSFTWITLSVMCGAASCADVLIQHGADVTALDGAGRSAVQLARANALVSHPRILKVEFSLSISDEDDAETLAVVERAFNLKFQGSTSLEHYAESIKALTPQPSAPHGPESALRKTLAKVLGIALTPTQMRLLHDRLRGLLSETQKIWSLSFYKALLMRFLYVSSYAILLAVEVNTFIKGHKRIPVPSRFLLSAFALLILALVWGSSQMGISWGPITA